MNPSRFLGSGPRLAQKWVVFYHGHGRARDGTPGPGPAPGPHPSTGAGCRARPARGLAPAQSTRAKGSLLISNVSFFASSFAVGLPSPFAVLYKTLSFQSLESSALAFGRRCSLLMILRRASQARGLIQLRTDPCRRVAM